MTVALVGAGTAALRAHLPALGRGGDTDAVRVVAVVDPHEEHCAEVARRSPGARTYADVATAIAEARPDLVIVASPPSTHLAAVATAFSAGVDVVCEKPLGVAPGDARVLAELCAAHPERMLVPVHQYRFAPAWRRVQALYADAVAAGRPVDLRVEVERPGTDPLSSGGWRSAGLREGGVLGDHGVHYLALAWTLDGDVTLRAAHQAGDPGREHATVDLATAGGDVRIEVSYAGERRRNLVQLTVAGGPVLRWLDGQLDIDPGDGSPSAGETTPALSDRQTVNDLYGDLYDEVLLNRDRVDWRRSRTTEAVAVGRLLAGALDVVR